MVGKQWKVVIVVNVTYFEGNLMDTEGSTSQIITTFCSMINLIFDWLRVRVSEREWEWEWVSKSEWMRVIKSIYLELELEWGWVKVSEKEWKWVRASKSVWQWKWVWVRVSVSELENGLD